MVTISADEMMSRKAHTGCHLIPVVETYWYATEIRSVGETEVDSEE